MASVWWEVDETCEREALLCPSGKLREKRITSSTNRVGNVLILISCYYICLLLEALHDTWITEGSGDLPWYLWRPKEEGDFGSGPREHYNDWDKLLLQTLSSQSEQCIVLLYLTVMISVCNRFWNNTWTMCSWGTFLTERAPGMLFRTGWMFSVVERSKGWR